MQYIEPNMSKIPTVPPVLIHIHPHWYDSCMVAGPIITGGLPPSTG